MLRSTMLQRSRFWRLVPRSRRGIWPVCHANVLTRKVAAVAVERAPEQPTISGRAVVTATGTQCSSQAPAASRRSTKTAGSSDGGSAVVDEQPGMLLVEWVEHNGLLGVVSDDPPRCASSSDR